MTKLSQRKKNQIVKATNIHAPESKDKYLASIEGELYSSLAKLFNKKGITYSKARPQLNILYRRLQNDLQRQMNKDMKVMEEELRDAMIESYDSTSKSLGNDRTLSNRKVKSLLDFPWSGATFRTRTLQHMETLFKSIQNEVAKELKGEKNYLKVIDRLAKRFETYNSRMYYLKKSETEHFVQEGANATYKDKHVQKVQWVTLHDDATCLLCSALDGQVFDINNTPPLPQHGNCRCRLVPYEI